MNPAVFGCFSRFSHFLNFGLFWRGFTTNFNSLAWFPARGWFRITLALNFQARRKFQIGRNRTWKNSSKYQLCSSNESPLETSPRPLALHALIIMPESCGKKSQMWKRSHKTSESDGSGDTNYPKCQLILKLWPRGIWLEDQARNGAKHSFTKSHCAKNRSVLLV